MTEPTQPTQPVDPKEAMRQALEAKKNAQHGHAAAGQNQKNLGSTHGKAAGKREFRRKSG